MNHYIFYKDMTQYYYCYINIGKQSRTQQCGMIYIFLRTKVSFIKRNKM